MKILLKNKCMDVTHTLKNYQNERINDILYFILIILFVKKTKQDRRKIEKAGEKNISVLRKNETLTKKNKLRTSFYEVLNLFLRTTDFFR
jgi:Ca2+/Na+ antiporter